MLRSPIFYLLIFLSFLSCQEKKAASVKSDKSRAYGDTLQQKAVDYFKKSNYNSAFYYFNKSKIAFETNKDSANIVFNLIQMANIQQINGDYYGSKETLTEALPYSKNDYNYTAAINNLFGIAYKELSLYSDAVFYYNEAIKNSADESAKLSPLNNIAVIYTQQKKYDQAIHILESLLRKKQITDKSKNRFLDNLGFAYFKKGEKEKGLMLMSKSLNLREQSSDSYGSIASYLHIAEYYAKTDSQKFNQYALHAYQTATDLNSIDERLDALSLLIIKGQNFKTSEYARKFVFLNDSILKIRNNYKNKFAKIKYDSKKEKDENQKLRLEKAENLVALKDAENERNIFIASFVAFILLLVYLKKQYDNRNRIKNIKIAYDTETRIAKDIHDGIANDVFHAITYTQTQPLTNENNKENLLQKLDSIYSRVRGISRENNDIDTGSNFPKNLKEMLSTYNNSQTNVIINGVEKINWDSVEDLKKIAIQRVLHELMVNMKKHSQAPVVSIKFNTNSNSLLIDYSDNGKGCEKSKIIKNGLQNMENRILAIKGTITFETEPDKGFKVKITMPK
ncbi:ATP-binding protein [Flavobacterium crocinum]|uniref:histidine kinase n=1 Tax=Flavobacterium crocinum TaxID=2183896 RepID=A0A2S1YSL0_9FLAO|nr:ATP-binding protein [Flavobacterium crocinum]AWK07087.1 ATP-binding protein [Flavobacterium crocinum]